MSAFTFKRLGFTTVVLASCVAGDVWGQIHYTVTDLGTLPGGSSSYAFAINNNGQVVGSAWTSNGTFYAFLYSGGSMTDLGTLGGTNSEALSINNLGQVVGWAENSDSVRHAFLYSGGTMLDLGTRSAEGINDNGQVVGNYASGAFLYSGDSMTDLNTLAGGSPHLRSASAINNSGQIVGNVTIGGPDHAFLYSDGSVKDLGTLGGNQSAATDINKSGYIVGWGNTSTGFFHAFLSDGTGPMQDLGTLGGNISYAYGINDNGQIVGQATASGNSPQHAFIYSSGVMHDLNNLIGPTSGWTLYGATGINDSGQICGYGTNPSGQTRALLLTPTSNPEPPTISWKGGNDDTSTAWGVANNWSSGNAPDVPGVNVRFGTQPANCPIVDMVSVGRTVGNITFAATTSTTIRSSYGFALTLDNHGTPSIIDVAGSHTISASVIINNDTTISGSGSLNLSGGISGQHTLTILGNLTATSIQVDTLTIGSTGATVVPEPSMIFLISISAIGSLSYAWGWKKRRALHIAAFTFLAPAMAAILVIAQLS